MKTLNVLYQSSNYYAPITGVSITSLFENNKNIDIINIYFLNDNLSDININKFNETCKKYNRNIFFINTDQISDKLKKLNVPLFHGSYTTYFKLFAVNEINIPTDRILYIDSDTIIIGSLVNLIDLNFEDNLLAMVYDNVPGDLKVLIDISLNEKYYNAGIILFNKIKWIKEKCEDEIINYINSGNKYFTDQCLINLLFNNNIKLLEMYYNISPSFYIFGIKESLYISSIPTNIFYNYEQILYAINNPVIHHCMGGFTGRPWEKNNCHPQKELFHKYVNLSLWKIENNYKINWNIFYSIQYVLYKILPRFIYIFFHKKLLTLFIFFHKYSNINKKK